MIQKKNNSKKSCRETTSISHEIFFYKMTFRGRLSVFEE